MTLEQVRDQIAILRNDIARLEDQLDLLSMHPSEKADALRAELRAKQSRLNDLEELVLDIEGKYK